jgi:hypothetical protein
MLELDHPLMKQALQLTEEAVKAQTDVSIAHKFPEAFKRGMEDSRAHYARVESGEIGEREDLPPHPYQFPEGQRETEWHAYNAGWFSGIPA